MKKWLLVLLLCVPVMGFSVEPAVSRSTQTVRDVRQIKVGKYALSVEIMATEQDRMQGMMFRTRMDANEGMLFVFGQTARYCMWMKNTKIPLSVAFLDEKGTIVNMADMQPETEDSHCARKPVRYALEVPQGWFKRHHIKEGLIISDVLSYDSASN